MFRRNKENKAKLEHKLYLARETPEPVFDLSECGIRNVPQGIYSLCRVFLKEVLRLDRNCLSSLSGGGHLKDLQLLKVLDLHDNAFVYLPDDIHLLRNLMELHVNSNQLKKLPESLCNLTNLRILNVAENSLKYLPGNLGNLAKLRLLCATGNKHLSHLPKSLCKAQRLSGLEVDAGNFMYPPAEVVSEGADAVLRYICNDVGVAYAPPKESEIEAEQDECVGEDLTDNFEAKIRTLETIKKQKLQEFLEIEKANELLQKQEFELANAQKVSREKLLADITRQQYKLDLELTKIQQIREVDRFRLIEQVQEAEQNADVAIKQLLALNNEPLVQLLEQEKREEERLLAAANKYNETLRKTDILADMQDILHQETKRFQQLHQDRIEVSRSILEQELQSDYRLSEILEVQDSHRAGLVSKLLEDSYLQKAAVGTLLERGDARSWGLVQQVKLVESQLAALTNIEMDKKKLQIDQHLNDLAEKRINLSILLMDLLDQQKERRQQLLSTLQILEDTAGDSAEDFWLRQYQRLLDKLPSGLSEAQKNMDPALAQSLLVNGVIHCLPFLAKLTQCQYDVENVTEIDLTEAGVTSGSDRIHILDAFHMYKKELSIAGAPYEATAPQLPIEEASAPLPEQAITILESECVICMDNECQVIYVPCGHLCCCTQCSTTVAECPLCRTVIEHKIRVVMP